MELFILQLCEAKVIYRYISIYLMTVSDDIKRVWIVTMQCVKFGAANYQVRPLGGTLLFNIWRGAVLDTLVNPSKHVHKVVFIRCLLGHFCFS